MKTPYRVTNIFINKADANFLISAVLSNINNSCLLTDLKKIKAELREVKVGIYNTEFNPCRTPKVT
jgi:hypothetical protein